MSSSLILSKYVVQLMEYHFRFKNTQHCKGGKAENKIFIVFFPAPPFNFLNLLLSREGANLNK